MTTVIVCPECQRKLRIPEAALGTSFRCPACKTLIAPDSEPESPSASNSVKRTQSPRSDSAPSRGQPPREEEPEEDIEPEEKRPLREKPRKKRSKPKKASAGLMIGLMVGGTVLILLVLGGGGGLLWYSLRNKAIPDTEWQTFTPPGGDCTILMPGTPEAQTLSNAGIGISGSQYVLERENGKEAFGLAIYEIAPHILRPSLMEDLAKGFRKGVMDAMGGGEETSKTSITLGNVPGLEFQCKMTARRGLLIGRVYLAKVGNRHRAYLFTTLSQSLRPNRDDAARFLDSFKITAPTTAPELSGAAAPGGPNPPAVVNPPQANPKPNPPPGIRRPRSPRRQRP